MGKKESDITVDIRLQASKAGAVLWKNVRGLFTSPNGAHKISAGLQAKGSSDLIGYIPTVITPDMVGQTVAIFLAVEVKTDRGVTSPDQKRFIECVTRDGGKAGVAKSAEDAINIIASP